MPIRTGRDSDPTVPPSGAQALAHKIRDKVVDLQRQQFDLIEQYTKENRKKPSHKRLREVRRKWEELETLRIMIDDDYSARYKLLSGKELPEFLKDAPDDLKERLPDDVAAQQIHRLAHDLRKNFPTVTRGTGVQTVQEAAAALETMEIYVEKEDRPKDRD